MKKYAPFILTREKHLDHMVRVVPFITTFYGIWTYVLIKVMPEVKDIHIQMDSIIMVLGISLVAMISAFITYDVKHQVSFSENHLEIKFFTLKKTIPYSEIKAVLVSDPKSTFSNLMLVTKNGSVTFYFIDDADDLKTFLESQGHSQIRPKQLNWPRTL